MNETTKIKNLWGNLPVENNIRTPYVILKEQASLLTEATNGLLIGNVDRETLTNNSKYNFECMLEIIVPSLDNYSISVLEVFYPVLNIYPSLVVNKIVDSKQYNCNIEEDLYAALEQILSSKEVKRIISSLLNEIRSDIEDDVIQAEF